MTFRVSENHASWPLLGTNVLCTCDPENETVITYEHFEIVMLYVCIWCNWLQVIHLSQDCCRLSKR